MGGELHIITEDQTWVNEVGRRLGIGEDQLKVHPMRHMLTMAIGVSQTLRIHSYAVPFEPGASFSSAPMDCTASSTLKSIREILASGEATRKQVSRSDRCRKTGRWARQYYGRSTRRCLIACRAVAALLLFVNDSLSQSTPPHSNP